MAAWTPQQLQQLANAYSQGYTNPTTGDVRAGNPTWTPPAAQNAALPNPIQPATFNPYSDPGFVLGNAAILQGNQNAEGNFNTQGFSYAQNSGYGFDASTGQTYAVAQGQPAYDPFNQATELQRSYDNNKRGTNNSYAASGQLYSGALKNAQAENTYQYNRASDSLQRGAIDYYHGLQSNLQATQQAGQTSYAQLVMDALNRYSTSQGG